jgi:SAM-dependent methyltransferase
MNPSNQGTPRFFADVGIVQGMRVLDLGCGTGDVTRLVARLVGPTGAVVGVDRDENAVATAREQQAEAGSGGVTYLTCDVSIGLPVEDRFDAIVGRRVLMYLPDPAATLAQILPSLRPGGLVAFQEHAAPGMPVSAAPLPLHAKVHRWMWDTVAREGGNVSMGLTLPTLFKRTGLVVEQVRAEAVLFPPDVPSALTPIIRAMMPRIVAQAVASEAEIEIETLDQRLEHERREINAAVLWDMAYLASARKPL